MRIEDCLPDDWDQAVLLGRIWDPAVAGPTPVVVRGDVAIDMSALSPTTSGILDHDDASSLLPYAQGAEFDLAALLANSVEATRDPAKPWLLAPCDLQAVKASGVTFVASLLERVIEEQARGDPSRAASLRTSITKALGDNLADIVPGSAAAAEVKTLLIAEGMWSQYLEVGIGPDAEVFTKTAPMASVGTGADIGIHPKSEWNNPEPEIVLAVDGRGTVKGAALGNDVNLRDFEGRSALLLGKTKDNNASSAIGPFIRLFDAHFTVDDVRRAQVSLSIAGTDGFRLDGVSDMARISRDPLDLVEQASGNYHQYPDGFMLYLGTMFAPTQDRGEPGQGFTHNLGDVVTIRSSKLGALINRVGHCDKIAPWTFGTRALMENLASRGLLKKGNPN
jgi:fumarylacetoacetate (FAA) hydrolase family protein